jgi:hypothetical protein
MLRHYNLEKNQLSSFKLPADLPAPDTNQFSQSIAKVKDFDQKVLQVYRLRYPNLG